MMLLKIENKNDGRIRYAASRTDVKNILQLSEQSVTRVMKGVADGRGIVNTATSIVRMVEVDESSIKEICKAKEIQPE